MIARRQTLTPRRPGALACGILVLGWCVAMTVEAAFVSPFPSLGGSRGKARAAVVLERRGTTTTTVAGPAVPAPSIYSAASGQGEEEPALRKKSKKEEERKAKHFEFLKEVAQNKKQARANKAKYRDQRDEYLEEMRKAFKLMQIKEREESGFKWVKRPKRERQIPLKELTLGAKHDGVVITVKEHGAYVDFGAKKDGFVRLRDMSDTDFVLDARDYVRPGDSVDFYVKYVSPEEGIVTGSLVPADIETVEEQEARTPLADVQEDDELWGEVTKVSNYGAFVDVGVEVQGFLHIIYYPKRYQGALTQDVFTPGQRLRVWAMEVDTEKRRLKLTAERPRTLPRVDYSWFMGGYEVDGDPEAPGAATSMGEPDDESLYATPYEEGQGLQARGRGKRAMERMRDWKWEEDGKRGGGEKKGAEEEVVHDLDARPPKEEEDKA